MLVSVFFTQAKRKCPKKICSDNQILDWLWRVVLFVLMVWQRFPDAAELNILTIKPTSTQFGPRPIFQDLLSSKDFLSMWNWEFHRKDLFSWLIVIFFSFLGLIPLVILIFLNLRILSRWIHFLHILPPSYSSSSMLCSFLILPETTPLCVPMTLSHTSSHSSSKCISPSLGPWMTFAPKAWGAFAADWKWGRPAPTATPPQVW